MPLSERDRRALVVLGVVALLALLAVLGVRFLGGGQEVAAPPGPPPVASSPAPSPTPTQGAAPQPRFSGRDPFSPPPGLGTPSPTSTASPSPTGTPTATPTPTSSPTAPGGGASRTVSGHTVVLLDVFRRAGRDMAQVEVDGTVYTVAEGQTFAEDFRLVSAAGSCARISFQGAPFTLCVSELK